MSRTRKLTAAMLLCVGTFAVAQRSGKSSIHLPKVFAPDDENRGFENAILPSDLILDALLNTTEAQQDDETREALAKLDRESQRKLFRLVRVDLGNLKEEDYIALGSRFMTGADNSWFWIVQVQRGKAKVLLFTNGLTVEILRRRTNFHYDIKECWGGNAGWGCRWYQYTGSAYRLVKKNWKEAKP